MNGASTCLTAGIPLNRKSAETRRYPLSFTMTKRARFVLLEQKPCRKVFSNKLKTRSGLKSNGTLPIFKFRRCQLIIIPRFKLHLRPRTLASSHIGDADIPPLPRNKTAVIVFADFLRYLYECARSYIQDTHPNGSDFWISVERHIEFVLSLPNGWEGAQQSQMRRAAVLAGLIPDGDGQARVQFVTEGEASLHFCVKKGLMTDAVTVCSSLRD